MICNCSILPDFYQDPWTPRESNLPGISQFKIYFDSNYELDLQNNCDFLTDKNKQAVLCQCRHCQQLWYIELAPDESICETFAAKIQNREQWSAFSAEPIKQFLTILAFGGFDQRKCIWKDCEDYALKGIDICQKHYGTLY